MIKYNIYKDLFIFFLCLCLIFSLEESLATQCYDLLSKKTNQENKVSASVIYPEAAPENFYSTKLIGPWKGMEKPPGQRSLLGKLAFATYTSENGQTKNYTGRVIDEYESGFQIIDERTGETHQILGNIGEIKSVKIEPFEYKWKKLEYGANKAQLFELIESTVEPFGLIKIGLKNLFGSLSVETVSPGIEVVILRDIQGNKHFLDPDYVGTDFLIIPKSNMQEVIFSTLTAETIKMMDTRKSERLDLVEFLVSRKKYYDDPIYYDFFLKDLSYTKALLYRWYDRHSKVMIDKVSSELGERYIVLLTDPGVANRVDELIILGKKYVQKNPDASPSELRAFFSEHLGRVKIFRGMMLTEQQKRKALKEGIYARGFLNSGNIQNSLINTLDSLSLKKDVPYLENYPKSPGEEISGRIHRLYKAEKSMWISTSKYKEIAESVGYHNSGKINEQGYKLHVFEIEIPKISTIKLEGLFKQVDRYSKEMIAVGSKFKTSLTGDLGVEVFIPYRIKPDDIIKVTTHDSPPAEWRIENSNK